MWLQDGCPPQGGCPAPTCQSRCLLEKTLFFSVRILLGTVTCPPNTVQHNHQPSCSCGGGVVIYHSPRDHLTRRLNSCLDPGRYCRKWGTYLVLGDNTFQKSWKSREIIYQCKVVIKNNYIFFLSNLSRSFLLIFWPCIPSTRNLQFLPWTPSRPSP
jgi:hypothetical protein